MKLVITGANGFIGSWLCKSLIGQDDYEIYAVVRRGSDSSALPSNRNLFLTEIDYGKDEELYQALYGKDIVIHLIGQMGKYGVPDVLFENTNVKLTREILTMSEKAGIKQFIFCSTPGVQGFGNRLANEEDPYAPRNIYEKTKVEAEEYIMDFCKASRIEYTIIRPDFVYGPGDVRRVKMYRNIKDKKFILTTNGKSYLHPTYITDVVQGFMKAIGNPNSYHQIFNISAGVDITSEEYLTIIAENVRSHLIHINIGYTLSCFAASFIEFIFAHIFHREAFVTKNKIDFLAVDHSTSNKKAKKLLGYEPQISVKEGMSITIKWCEENHLID